MVAMRIDYLRDLSVHEGVLWPKKYDGDGIMRSQVDA